MTTDALDDPRRGKASGGTIHVEAVRALVAFAALRGMPPERVVAHFELGAYPLTDLDTRLPVAVVGRLWVELPELLMAPGFRARARARARTDAAPVRRAPGGRELDAR